MMMSRNQSKLWLPMSINQNLNDYGFTLLSASSLILNRTVSYSLWPPTRFNKANSFDSRSALIVSKYIIINLLAFITWPPPPLWLLRVIRQVPLPRVEKLYECQLTLLWLHINVIFVFIFEMFFFEVIRMDVCHFDGLNIETRVSEW